MKLPRILMFLAAIWLVALYIWPIWSITLYAPQYPTGVTMYIHINKISGETEGTLQNINILNHYVGMAPIDQDSIPELQYFQYVVAALIALGILAAVLNKKWVFLTWTILLIILGTLGIYDFYLWEYDYGHNLSPTAPIKVPGAVYQPPLIGKKIILNFTAYSWPHIGGVFVGASVLFGFAAFWFKHKITKR